MPTPDVADARARLPAAAVPRDPLRLLLLPLVVVIFAASATSSDERASFLGDGGGCGW